MFHEYRFYHLVIVGGVVFYAGLFIGIWLERWLMGRREESMGWTHRICEECWNKRNPDREPVKVKSQYDELKPCCFCGKETASGIFVRFDPKQLNCKCE